MRCNKRTNMCVRSLETMLGHEWKYVQWQKPLCPTAGKLVSPWCHSSWVSRLRRSSGLTLRIIVFVQWRYRAGTENWSLSVCTWLHRTRMNPPTGTLPWHIGHSPHERYTDGTGWIKRPFLAQYLLKQYSQHKNCANFNNLCTNITVLHILRDYKPHFHDLYYKSSGSTGECSVEGSTT